jgi:hypothetical protein
VRARAQILSRFGVLSTTGHSTNFVMVSSRRARARARLLISHRAAAAAQYIELPHDRRSIINNVGLADCDTWIKAGVAAFCALRY